MISVHVDTLKWFAMWVVLFFFAWNWAVAENEVRHLTTVGSSMGRGWRECMVALEPRVGQLEDITAQAVGLSLQAQVPR